MFVACCCGLAVCCLRVLSWCEHGLLLLASVGLLFSAPLGFGLVVWLLLLDFAGVRDDLFGCIGLGCLLV